MPKATWSNVSLLRRLGGLTLRLPPPHTSHLHGGPVPLAHVSRACLGWSWSWTSAVGVSPAREHRQPGAAIPGDPTDFGHDHRIRTGPIPGSAACLVCSGVPATPTLAAPSTPLSTASSAQTLRSEVILCACGCGNAMLLRKCSLGAEDVGACNRDAPAWRAPRGCINDLRGRSDSVGP